MRLNFFAIKKKNTKNQQKPQKANEVRIKLANPTFPMLTGVLSLFLSLTDIVSDQCLYILIHQGPLSPVTSRCRTAPGSLFHSMSQY